MKFKIFRFKKVNSTNNTAIRIIQNSNLNYGMVISEMQNNGRGQYGKKWISYKGNLFISFFYNLENFTVSVKQLTKINCLLVKKLLSLYCKNKIILKKPNDLLIDGKKICGILQETFFYKNKRFLIVGIGVNIVNSPKIYNYPTSYLNNYSVKKINKTVVSKYIKSIYERNIVGY